MTVGDGDGDGDGDAAAVEYTDPVKFPSHTSIRGPYDLIG